jgi:hypothetical protein
LPRLWISRGALADGLAHAQASTPPCTAAGAGAMEWEHGNVFG